MPRIIEQYFFQDKKGKKDGKDVGKFPCQNNILYLWGNVPFQEKIGRKITI